VIVVAPRWMTILVSQVTMIVNATGNWGLTSVLAWWLV
jgi:hypothetical protein